MKMRFKDLKIGERFHLDGFEGIKIDDRIYGGKLSERPANAIKLSNNHKIVVGNMLLVDRVESVE